MTDDKEKPQPDDDRLTELSDEMLAEFRERMKNEPEYQPGWDERWMARFYRGLPLLGVVLFWAGAMQSAEFAQHLVTMMAIIIVIWILNRT